MSAPHGTMQSMADTTCTTRGAAGPDSLHPAPAAPAVRQLGRVA